jgi:uncharacterized membrane protein YedE/YeeE
MECIAVKSSIFAGRKARNVSAIGTRWIPDSKAEKNWNPDSMLEKIFVDIWPWYVSGPAVGLFVLAFLYFKDRALGASSTFQAVLEAAQGKGDPAKLDLSGRGLKSSLPLDPRDPAPRWRIWFLGGIFLGGLLGWLGGGESTGTPGLPGFSEFFGVGTGVQLAILFAGGILIGAGTRMSGGCTSGHAITGISNLQLPSLYATCVFFAVGMALSFFLRWLLI